jgi:hypothetical protein
MLWYSKNHELCSATNEQSITSKDKLVKYKNVMKLNQLIVKNL